MNMVDPIATGRRRARSRDATHRVDGAHFACVPPGPLLDAFTQRVARRGVPCHTARRSRVRAHPRSPRHPEPRDSWRGPKGGSRGRRRERGHEGQCVVLGGDDDRTDCESAGTAHASRASVGRRSRRRACTSGCCIARTPCRICVGEICDAPAARYTSASARVSLIVGVARIDDEVPAEVVIVSRPASSRAAMI